MSDLVTHKIIHLSRFVLSNTPMHIYRNVVLLDRTSKKNPIGRIPINKYGVPRCSTEQKKQKY